MSAYAVDKICHRLLVDEAFREALRADPEATLRDAVPPLDDAELRALVDGDVGWLSRAGCTHFLLVQPARLELFGLTVESYADRIRAEYTAERQGG